MQKTSKTVAPALRALLEHFIDYAGVYPPASLPFERALANYEEYREQDCSWMLRSFVIGAGELGRVPAGLDGCLAVLGDSDQARAASIEAKAPLTAKRPVYCEVPVKDLGQLDAVQQSGCFAKIRTGGVKPEMIPSVSEVAAFINGCAARRLPFKATAGLHHPIRAEYALTYQADAPRAVMHGFLNVLMASAFAWHGDTDIESILSETDASVFSFADDAHFRDRWLHADQIREARSSFIHSVGSCSFDEPVHELLALGLI